MGQQHGRGHVELARNTPGTSKLFGQEGRRKILFDRQRGVRYAQQHGKSGLFADLIK